ncbi:acylneuraminate cytidylyltransferase family protein [Flavobacterium silvaticum]|uniref:Acylneuraminate cytidylyltransferase family protein n=1 Tax=Flavobacterium silvaticum TaxID=1852020 RepID=A0A972FQG5_9FLAO|nr:acylneuraminate cytidylyltransferase family protein [Flavobacterium silvaticum]NMH29485.1 acylneuraminate cytidylyltransferase family protein [Flavobacterium silvaticum]
MKTIAIIPARGGSKRLPGKNLLLLGEIPLIAHSILYALAQPEIEAVFVSTDDPDIAATSSRYGAEVIIRPHEISGDHEPTVTALQHVLEHTGLADVDVVLLQPTNPLRPKALFSDCFRIFSEGNHPGLFTVSRHHHKLGKIEGERFLPFNYEPGQRSQDLEPLFYENGLLYISRAEVIRESKVISGDAFPYVVDHIFGTVDIDTADDLDYAAYLLKKHQH